MRRLRSVAALAAVALAVAGCGLTDEGVEPGVAASMGGETLALSKVDRAVIDYCDLRAANPQANAAPTAGIRGQFVLGWAQAQAVEELAEEYDVRLPVGSIDRADVEAAWGELGTIDDDNYDTFEWLTWIQQRVSQPVYDIGMVALSRDGELDGSQDPGAKGGELIVKWLADHKPEINPTFGSYDAEKGALVADDLSIAVSEVSVAGLALEEMAADDVAALPATQQCGPAAASAQAPGA